MLDETLKGKTRQMYRSMLPFINPEILKTKQELEKALTTGSKFQVMTRLGRLENAKAAISRGLEKDRFVFSSAEESGIRLVDEIANQKLRAENLKQRQGELDVVATHSGVAASTYVEMFHSDRIRNMQSKSRVEKKAYSEELESHVAHSFKTGLSRSELDDETNWNKFFAEFERRAEVFGQSS